MKAILKLTKGLVYLFGGVAAVCGLLGLLFGLGRSVFLIAMRAVA